MVASGVGSISLMSELFEELAVTTKNGTVIERATLQAVEQALDAWYYSQRTGINIMEIASRLPVKKIAERAQCEVTDKRKIMSQFEKEYDEWLKNRPVSTGFGMPVLDPTFAKELPKNLHSILKSAGNKMKIDGLAVAYALKTERALDEESTNLIRNQIRVYCYGDHAFQIGKGGMATVYRMTDDKGKATDVEVSEPNQNQGSSSKVIQRYTAKVKALGLTKSQFETAKAQGNSTMPQLQQWAMKHKQ